MPPASPAAPPGAAPPIRPRRRGRARGGCRGCRLCTPAAGHRGPPRGGAVRAGGCGRRDGARRGYASRGQARGESRPPRSAPQPRGRATVRDPPRSTRPVRVRRPPTPALLSPPRARSLAGRRGEAEGLRRLLQPRCPAEDRGCAEEGARCGARCGPEAPCPCRRPHGGRLTRQLPSGRKQATPSGPVRAGPLLYPPPPAAARMRRCLKSPRRRASRGGPGPPCAAQGRWPAVARQVSVTAEGARARGAGLSLPCLTSSARQRPSPCRWRARTPSRAPRSRPIAVRAGMGLLGALLLALAVAAAVAGASSADTAARNRTLVVVEYREEASRYAAVIQHVESLGHDVEVFARQDKRRTGNMLVTGTRCAQAGCGGPPHPPPHRPAGSHGARFRCLSRCPAEAGPVPPPRPQEELR